MQSEHHRQEEEDKEKQARPAVGQQGPSQHPALIHKKCKSQVFVDCWN